MPAPTEKLPPLPPTAPARPPCVLVPPDAPDWSWESGSGPHNATASYEDGCTVPSVAVDDFNTFASTQIEALLSKLIMSHRSSIGKLAVEHQSSIRFLQSEIKSLQDKLWNAREKPMQDVSFETIEKNAESSGCRVKKSDSTRSMETHPAVSPRSETHSFECNGGPITDGTRVEQTAAPTTTGVEVEQSLVAVSPDGRQNEGPVSPPGSKGFNRQESRDRFCSEGSRASKTSRHTAWGDIIRKVNNPKFSMIRRMKVIGSETVGLSGLAHGASTHLSGIENMSRFRKFVLSNTFEIITGFVILLNTFAMALQLQYGGYDIGNDIGFRPETYGEPANKVWPGAKEAFFVSDIVFNCCFVVELLLRIYANRLASIRMRWMWFDLIIVTLGVIDTATAGSGLGFDPTMIRLVRLVRLFRLLKILHAMESFDSLFLLLKAIHASVGALLWSFMILLAVKIGTGLLLCQLLQSWIENEDTDPKARDNVFKYFGTFTRTMLTMFEITQANWVPTCRLLFEEVHGLFFLFYVVYRCMFCFAVLKVIAAVFIAETNRVLAGDAEITLMKAHKEKLAYKNKLSMVFQSIDNDGNGVISWAEMQYFLTDAQMSSWLATVGFNRTDFEKLFWLIEVNGSVNTEKFLSMVNQLKGQAKTVDLLTMMKVIHKMDKKLQKVIQTATSSSPADVQHVIDELQADLQENALVKLGEGGSMTADLDQADSDLEKKPASPGFVSALR